jgi:hypothetical protein
VTLTLGGTPATSLLAATSITAGWTGTLAVGRGGFGNSTGTLTTAAQPNVTSVGTLDSLMVTGIVKAGHSKVILTDTYTGNGAYNGDRSATVLTNGTGRGSAQVVPNSVTIMGSETHSTVIIAGNVAAATLDGTTQATTFSSIVTATAFFESSDLRKKNIIKRDGDMVYFNWKKGSDKKMHIGYIAQEVQKFMPDAVQKDSKGFLSVNYTEVLVSKVRALEKENDDFKEIILEFKKRLDKLENK